VSPYTHDLIELSTEAPICLAAASPKETSNAGAARMAGLWKCLNLGSHVESVAMPVHCIVRSGALASLAALTVAACQPVPEGGRQMTRSAYVGIDVLAADNVYTFAEDLSYRSREGEILSTRLLIRKRWPSVHAFDIFYNCRTGRMKNNADHKYNEDGIIFSTTDLTKTRWGDSNVDIPLDRVCEDAAAGVSPVPEFETVLDFLEGTAPPVSSLPEGVHPIPPVAPSRPK
jgi:hypothetical protein